MPSSCDVTVHVFTHELYMIAVGYLRASANHGVSEGSLTFAALRPRMLMWSTTTATGGKTRMVNIVISAVLVTLTGST